MGKIEKSKRELARYTKENTSFMEQIVNMGYSQLQLDSALNARIANVTVNDTEPMVELKEMERERMKDLLQLRRRRLQHSKQRSTSSARRVATFTQQSLPIGSRPRSRRRVSVLCDCCV